MRTISEVDYLEDDNFAAMYRYIKNGDLTG